jgi:DNA (cytosine-5)-methyltransferase 1
MTRRILVADLLCGAGGSSTGAERALARLGLEMDLVCVNHWPVAIATHARNHPRARHYCQDISTVRPHQVVPEGYLDLLMASPTCTHHSIARGGKPTSDQQRSDPWHIITWFTELRVKCAIIENVWEFIGWGPVDPQTEKPIKERKGEYFRAWIDTIRALGATAIEWRKLNAADYGGATTRARFIMIVRFDGQPIVWPAATHSKIGGDGLKRWRPARDIIDWSIKGRSIFARKKPLAPKTLARIYAGAVKFMWPEPFLVILRNHMAGQSIDAPLPTIAANGGHIALAESVRRAEPFVMATGSSGAPRGAGDPLPTVTTGGAGSQDPGCARPMLVEPFIIANRTNNAPKDPSEAPLPCMTTATGGGIAIVEPFVLSRHGDGAPRGVDEPTPTQVAKHSHCLISPYYGSGSGETCNTANDPLPTVTAKARFGVVVPVTHTKGGNAARDLDEPLPTLTTAKGGEFAMVMPVTHVDHSARMRDVAADPMPTVTGANRGEIAVITAQFGEREGQAPRVHDLDEPLPTVTATGHVNLVEGVIDPALAGYDILFRMLEPHELAAAMGFNGVDAAYEFSGNKTEQVKQIGNAVSVEMMQACVTAVMGGEAGPMFQEAAE